MYMAQSPCSLLALADSPLLPFLFPFTYLETLLAVIGSRPPWSQVTRKLTSPFSTLPIPSPFQIPSTQVNCAPHYDNFMIPASYVRNTPLMMSSLSADGFR
jgi:hypothetical protein